MEKDSAVVIQSGVSRQERFGGYKWVLNHKCPYERKAEGDLTETREKECPPEKRRRLKLLLLQGEERCKSVLLTFRWQNLRQMRCFFCFCVCMVCVCVCVCVVELCTQAEKEKELIYVESQKSFTNSCTGTKWPCQQEPLPTQSSPVAISQSHLLFFHHQFCLENSFSG